MATSDVPHRHHSWCHLNDCIWLVQHLEHVDSGHLLHGTQEHKGVLLVIQAAVKHLCQLLSSSAGGY